MCYTGLDTASSLLMDLFSLIHYMHIHWRQWKVYSKPVVLVPAALVLTYSTLHSTRRIPAPFVLKAKQSSIVTYVIDDFVVSVQPTTVYSCNVFDVIDEV